ncbi:hypothetical protein ADL21_02765 [Streptomyces albus subsp. albus]|nr:hypothetical protein ADL21_02765 [Streptomyces albus subsp. albus]
MLGLLPRTVLDRTRPGRRFVDVLEAGGRTWRLPPDPDQEGHHHAYADQEQMGTAAPTALQRRPTRRRTATCGLLTTASGHTQLCRDLTAAGWTVADEDAYRPLPPNHAA